MTFARAQLALLLALGSVTLACESKLIVGEKQCPASDAMTVPLATDAVLTDWRTGFEADFCDFTQAGGYCVEDRQASNQIVSSPVHGGQFAAAFTVSSADDAGFQSRCVRQGALPSTAYYGAWFYFPKLVQNSRSWNLFHFRGGAATNVRTALEGEDQAGADVHSLWDVSLKNASNGDMQAFVFDFFNMSENDAPSPRAVPIGKWVHFQLYFKRAANATGRIQLYQDGVLLVDLADLITDDTDWGRWYVGDYSKGLKPPDSTLYVDDVSIADTL